MDNRKIDVLVAKEIFGFDVEPSSNYDGWYGDLIPIGDRMFVDPQGWVYDKGRQAVPCYSTNISDAWKVVSRILATWDNGRFERRFELSGDPDDKEAAWEASFGWRYDEPTNIEYPAACVSAMRPELAICLAALKLKGVDIDALEELK